MTSIFETLLASNTTTDNLFLKTLIHIGLSLIIGGIISAAYMLSDRTKNYSKTFALTTFILPSIVAVIIPFIGTDIARAVSLGGVFALVRFRSMPGDAKDILYIFFTMAAGLAVGVEQYAAALALVVLISIVLVVISRFFMTNNSEAQILKITIPEDMNYKNTFDDIFAKYLDNWKQISLKTTNMGSLFTINYSIRTKKAINEKEFIDQLRTRNGNLNIVLGLPEELSQTRL